MKLYKYTFRAIFDYNGKFSHTELELLEYPVLKVTPCGYWIHFWNKNNKKWVSKTGKNSFAFADKKDALENFIHRKRKQIGLIRFNLKRIREAKKLAEKLMEEFDIN